MSYTKRALAAASAMLLGVPIAAQAHTNSIGYVGDGTGGVTFWYGTYHSPAETTYNEGELKLEGANGTNYDPTIVSFDQLVYETPDGLVSGANYFESDGTQLVPYGDPSDSSNLDSFSWQGVTFTGLSAGDYTFTYIPLGDAESSQPTASPTAQWAPMNEPIRSYTFTLSAAALAGDADGDGINDATGEAVTPIAPATPTLVSSAAGTPIVTSSSVTQDRYVFNTAGDTRSYYQDTVTTTVTTPTTVDTYSDGSTVTTNGTATSSTSTTLATVPVWVETRTYDVQRSAYAPSGATPTVQKTHRYTATESGTKQKVNHHTTTGVTTPTVRTVTTTAVYTRVYTDGSADTVTTDPSVITYENSTSYAESYDSKDYFGRVDQLETLDKVAAGSNRLLNHLPSRTNQKVRVFTNGKMQWSNSSGYDGTTSIYGGGLELDLTKGWTIGGQYNKLNTELNGDDSHSHMNRDHFGVFNSFHGRDLSLITNAGWSNDKYDYSRNVEGIFNNAGKTEGKQWWVNNRLYAHLSRWFHPFIGHTVRNVTRDGYTESGDLRSARIVDAYNNTTHVGEAGARMETRFGGKSNELIGVTLEASYATDSSYEVVGALDVNKVLFVEGTHSNVDGMSNNSVAAKVKFRF